MSWGAWGRQFSTQEMIAQITTSLEAGITTFDHADIYGEYTTEHEFGKAFAKSGIERESIQLISKCGIQHDGGTRDNYIKHYNYSKEYIIWSVEESLRNLKTALENAYNAGISSGIEFTGEWLQFQIDLFNNKLPVVAFDVLTTYIQKYIDEAPFKQNAKKQLGLSNGRVQNLKLFKNTIIRYETDVLKNRSILIKEIDLKFIEKHFKTCELAGLGEGGCVWGRHTPILRQVDGDDPSSALNPAF